MSAILLALPLAVAGCNSTAQSPGSKSSTNASALPIRTSAAFDAGEADEVADVVEAVLPSVVSVASTRKSEGPRHGFFFGAPPQRRQQKGLGSGVILTAEGLVVTNNHVIENSDSVTVRTHDDREFDAEVVGTDPKSDLAVLQLEGDVSELEPIVVGDSASLRLGEVVLAVGNPFGVGQTVTMGIVSAKGRADMGIVDYEDFIQTDAAINPGNSGGALINTRGELVGINTAILSRTGGSMGIGFAIPTNMAVPIVEALRTEGHVARGFLGVVIQDMTAALSEAMEIDDGVGVLIADVKKGGPGDRAGLESGDVVVEVDGRAVDSTGRFRNMIAASGAGKKVRLTVLRDGKKKKVSVTLGELPTDPDTRRAESQGDDGAAVHGLAIKDLDGSLRNRLGVDESVQGAVIVGVKPGSKAAQARLRPGDVIVEINRQPVKNARQAKKLYAEAKGAKLLKVLRRGTSLYVVVK